MREDDCVMSRHPMHGDEALSSRADLPTPDVTVTRPERQQGYASEPPAHFDEAQAEQAL
jgi:prephenate dehydrogenase